MRKQFPERRKRDFTERYIVYTRYTCIVGTRRYTHVGQSSDTVLPEISMHHKYYGAQ